MAATTEILDGVLAKENRRRVSERDPDKRRADCERLQRLTNDAELGRQALLSVTQLVGRDVLYDAGSK